MADGRLVASVVMALVVGVGIAAWVVSARSIDVAPFREEPPAAVASAEASAPAAVGEVGGAVPAERRQTAGLASVRGVVVDGRGNPLAEVDVALGAPVAGTPESRRAMAPLGSAALVEPEAFEGGIAWPLQSARSGADGTFRFEDVAPGDYQLSAVLGIPTTQLLKLRPGEAAEVELRFPGDEVLVVGRLRPLGAAQPMQVTFRGGKLPVDRPAHLDRLTFRCLLSPGSYVVRVWNSAADRVDGEGRLVVAERELAVPAGAVSVPCDLDVPDLRIAVRAEGAGDGPIAGLQFEVQRAADPERAATQLRQGAAGGRVAEFGNLGLGEWTVVAHAPSLLPVEPVRCELSAAAPQASVVLPVQLGGVVRLVPRTRVETAFLTPPAVPVLVTSRGNELPGGTLRSDSRGLALTNDGSFGFAGVPVGRAELRVLDHTTAERVTFLPFEPLPAVAIDVQPGDHNRIELDLQRRAVVKLRVVDAVGRDDLAVTKLTVFAGERVVQGEATRTTRWRSPLPAGDYRVEIERPTGNRRERLQVGQQDLELILRP